MRPPSLSTLLLSSALLAGNQLVLASSASADALTLNVLVESVTGSDTLVLQNGQRTRAPISPGVYLVSPKVDALFRPGARASVSLERLAEDGNPAALAVELNGATQFVHDEGFTVNAGPGDRLHIAVMFAQSNDLFYAPHGGIALFDANGRPVSGDRTVELALWDAGTEVNEAPGAGADQAPRQKAPNTGRDEKGVVRKVSDGFVYPPTHEVIRVTIKPKG